MRPRRNRKVYNKPASRIFSTADGRGNELSPIILSLDEYEAIRLGDLEGLYQSDAAEFMNVSRQTFGRIIKQAHKKIAEHLVHGNSLIIKGGSVEFEDIEIECNSCGHQWTSSPERIEDLKCPECNTHHKLQEMMNTHQINSRINDVEHRCVGTNGGNVRGKGNRGNGGNGRGKGNGGGRFHGNNT